ncbi:hypothetical protein ACFRCI_46695 [Streptomyces sp. NPDC056638]|uniref:hypothetical protein n=1 Tax=Streptomyces sp. NPDC056638 TaxID=3345887 RepID=UPI0036A962EB
MDEVADGLPVREFRWYRGRKHYSGLAVAALPPDGGWMGKRGTAEEVVRRLGRECFGFLTEAGFTGPHDIDGGFDYAGHGLRITIYHYYWKNEAEVVADVYVLGDVGSGLRSGVHQLSAECGLGAVNHLPSNARSARLTELRVRTFAAALKCLLPFLLAPDRAALIRRASTRP